MSAKDNVNYNGKRSNIISSLKRKNLQLSKDIQTYLLDAADLTGLQRDKAEKFRLLLNKCASFTMYKQMTTGEYEHISSHTCDHKACFVCNFLRQKKIRRKYFAWFKANPTLTGVIDNRGKLKITTAAQAAEKYQGRDTMPYPYDVMHLTLTVPHSKKGFRGQYFYQEEIKKCFWYLRRRDWWLRFVYGGESGIEITKSDNGLHIHIHAMLLVKRFRQSRNILHKEILLAWNKLTVDKKANRKRFTSEMIESIKKGNKTLTDEEISKLDPKGSTLISLETVFFRDENGQRRHINEVQPENITGAILEIISYHFEPMAFDKHEGGFNLPLLVELLPEWHGLRIYDRFGCLYREKALNLNNNDYLSDLAEAKQAQAEANGTEPVPEERGKFIITNPALVFHDVKDNYKIKFSRKAIEQAMVLGANSTGEALAQLGYLTKKYKNNDNTNN